MRLVFSNMKKYLKESILGPLFKLLEALIELFVPLVVSDIIDKGIQWENTEYVIQRCVLLVVLGLIGFLFSITAQYFAAKAAVGISTNIRKTVFEHIQSLSYTELDSMGASSLITRLTGDSNQVQNGINLTLRLLLRSPFVVFGALIMAYRVDSKSATSFAIIIPILLVIVFGIMLISIPLYKKVQGKLDLVVRSNRENLSGVRVIRAFCQEEQEKVVFNKRNNELTGVQKLVGGISSLMNPLTYVAINLAIIALIKTGSNQVNDGIITNGQLVALYNYMCQILVELVKMANLIINITKAVACAQRIEATVKTKSSMTYGDFELDEKIKSIEFKDVSLKYQKSGDYSLKDISFSASSGETIGIIGGTGSGKSSLVNLVSRFYDTTEGSITINGKNIKDYTSKSLTEKIGVVPQKAVLFTGSIRDNMKWGKKDATDEQIMEALTIAQAKEVVAEKDGLDYQVEQFGRNFSGGQRQRLTIARALVKKPEILVLDDSASALDFATDAALRKSIKEMEGDSIIFIVSQRASSIMYSDKIIVLDDGQIAGIGTHDELLKNCDLYQEIYYTQFKKEGE